MTTQRQTMKQSTITVTTEQQRFSLTNMFTLHYQLLWYKWCYTVCLGNSQALLQKSRPYSMPMYLRETVQDRPDPLLNSTNFFSVVDRTPTHYFWSTGWEVISKSPSHYSMHSSLMSFRSLGSFGSFVFSGHSGHSVHLVNINNFNITTDRLMDKQH